MGLGSPAGEPLLHLVGGKSETNEIVVLYVIGNLVVQHSSLSIVVGILLVLGSEVLLHVMLSLLQGDRGLDDC